MHIGEILLLILVVALLIGVVVLAWRDLVVPRRQRRIRQARRQRLGIELINTAAPKASTLTLAIMGFLTVWCPFIFVWFIQTPDYPAPFRRIFTVWAILWCACAVVFFAVLFVPGIQLR